MRFLTCEPFLGTEKEQKTQYMDEADQFFNNPQLWYIKNANVFEEMTYLVIFSNLYHQIIQKEVNEEKMQNNLVNSKSLKDFMLNRLKCESFYNSVVQPTTRTDKIILVCRKVI